MSKYKDHVKEVKLFIEEVPPPEDGWYFQSWEYNPTLFEINNDDLAEKDLCILLSKETKYVTF